MNFHKQAIADLTPRGVLRAALNLGNPLLAKQTAPDTEPFGPVRRSCGRAVQTPGSLAQVRLLSRRG